MQLDPALWPLLLGGPQAETSSEYVRMVARGLRTGRELTWVGGNESGTIDEASQQECGGGEGSENAGCEHDYKLVG